MLPQPETFDVKILSSITPWFVFAMIKTAKGPGDVQKMFETFSPQTKQKPADRRP